jgi:hypothetical protein
MRKLLALVVTIGLLAACGDDTTGATTSASTAADTTESSAESGTTVASEAVDIDSCALITDEEATEMAGEELEAAEDSPFGCPFVVPGEVIGEFTVRGYVGEGDATTAASEIVPDAAEVIPIDGIGDDAVIISSNGEVIDFVVVRQGDRFVLLNTTFLLFEPGTEEADRLTALAGVALQRLVAG